MVRSRARILQVLLAVTAAVVLSKNAVEVLGFINPRCSPATGRPTGVPQATGQQKPLTSRRAEAEGDEDGGFLKFLKVEQDSEEALSPEEYKAALDQEIMVERKKLYIGGEVKPGNKIVPWQDVDEEELEEQARKKLRKAGIFDPSEEEAEEEEVQPLKLDLIGGEDIRLKWYIGDPKDSVGYIVERKSAVGNVFVEIGTYEDQQRWGDLLMAKTWAGADYEFMDVRVRPGPLTYRILQRNRAGDVKVLHQKDIVVPVSKFVEFPIAAAVFLVVMFGTLTLMATVPQPDLP